jgi:hypothetical protein
MDLINKLYNYFKPTILNHKIIITVMLAIALFNLVYGRFVMVLGNITGLFIVMFVLMLLDGLGRVIFDKLYDVYLSFRKDK